MDSYKQSSYFSTIKSFCTRYPDLIFLRDFLGNPRRLNSPGRAAVLEFRAGSVPVRKIFDNVDALEDYFKNTRGRSCGHRLYLLEDISLEYVEAFGSYFWMDPYLFASQQNFTHWTSTRHDHGFPSKLPSTRRPDPLYTLHYYETIKLAKRPLGAATMNTFSNLTRRIERAKIDYPENNKDNIYMIRRNASFWSHKTGEGGWNGLMLVEPPIGDNVEITYKKKSRIERIPSEPYQKGYVDFSNWNRCSASSLKYEIVRGPPRTSMLDDIIYYWEEVASGDLIAAALNNPALSAVHLQKLVASNWLVLLEYIWAALSDLERTLWHFEDPTNENTEDLLARLNQTLAEGNRLRRRLSWYLDELEWTMRSLNITTDERDLNNKRQKDLSIGEDFKFIHARLHTCKQKVESLATVVTGLLSVCQGKISESVARTSAETATVSANEARLVSRLTVLAVIFIPLSFSASIFSMGGDFQPGGSRFWLYFAVSLPMLFLILGFVFLWRKASIL